MRENQIGVIPRTDDKYVDVDQVFSLIATELANSKSKHYGCSWVLKADGTLVHVCNEGK
jgi:hypothetical protein